MQSECRTCKRVRRESRRHFFASRGLNEGKSLFLEDEKNEKLPANNSSSRVFNDADFFVVPTNCDNHGKLSVYSSDKVGWQLLWWIKKICHEAKKSSRNYHFPDNSQVSRFYLLFLFFFITSISFRNNKKGRKIEWKKNARHYKCIILF